MKLKLVSKIKIGQSSNVSFTEQGGTIGRSNDCDWTLLDVDRYISNKHALISYQNEQFTLTDTSSNGISINNSSTPLGKQNSHILKKTDRIKIGSYEIEVENLTVLDTPQPAVSTFDQADDSDLLGLVMGGEVNSTDNNEADYLKISSSDNFIQSSEADDGLGLNDILASPASGYAKPVDSNPNSPFESSPAKKAEFVKPKQDPLKNQHYIANDSSIPEDWELSGILPAIPDYEPPKPSTQIPQEVAEEQIENEPVADQQNVPVEHEASFKPAVPIEPVEHTVIADELLVQIPEISNDPKVNLLSSTETEEPTSPLSTITSDKFIESEVEKPIRKGTDKFLHTLYNKLDLPKEYLDSIDEDAFADDIATVLLSTTKGLMSLLNSRTAFKQESRLSLTLVQPRSNNPLKFSIDPVDTLEMLLLKKKKGYLSAKESYEEAVDDIQLHQMAFLSGLQATLVGVLEQVSPESIESQINDQGRSFMGLKANSQYWQLYKDKQKILAKSVTENLNEVLSTYFSEAYQAQINNLKNDKL